MTNHLNSSQPPTKQQFATTFRLAGRIGFWVQLALGAVSGISLFFALFSRSVGERTSSPVIGFGIFLAVVGILVLGFRVYWAFRYRLLAKRLQASNPSLHPSKKDIIQVLQIGMIASLVGLLLAFLGAEATVAGVLGKALAQPQGVAVYNPENVIPAMDIFVALANVNMIGAHFFGSINSLWLLNWVDQ